MTWLGRRQVGRFVWARNSTAFGIDRSAGGMLVFDSFATRCSIFVLRGSTRLSWERARPQRKSGLRSSTKKIGKHTAIEKVREGLSRKLTGPELK